MKKSLFFILLLSVVSMAVFAENYKSYEAAADASHKALKEKIEGGKLKQVKLLKKGLSNQTTISYKIVSTDPAGQANQYDKKNPEKIKKEAQKFDFEGNLTVKDPKTKTNAKYVSNGYFIITKGSVKEKVKGQKQKELVTVYNEGDAVFDSEAFVKVPYFESEAQKKASDLVDAYYKEHKEFVNVRIEKVVPCEEGYKVTTSRTFYKDAQKYTGDKGTVIFTVRNGDTLEEFELLEQTEKYLNEFDNTPAPIVEEPVEEVIVDSRTNQEKLEQVVVNGFKLNAFTLSDENKDQLDQVAEILLSDNELEIELLGHSCELGDKETNYTFGIMRAKEAKKYLVSKGAEAKRIYVHSYGAKKPLVPNTTAENRAQNRRVEIKVIK